MKQMVVTMMLILSAVSSFAGTFKADDFNQMIQENQKAEIELRTHLQKEAGIQLNDKPGTVAREKLKISAEAEQIVAKTSSSIWKDKKKDLSEKKLEKAEMKRLSQ